MTITELLNELRRLGVHLSAINDKLLVDAPAGTLSADIGAAIREHKAELLRLFADVSASAAEEAVELQRVTSEHRLSLTQERIWAIDQLAPGNGQFNLPGSWWLTGPLDPDRFEAALNRLVGAHDIFRRRFKTIDGKAVVSDPVYSGVDFKRLSIEDIGGDRRDEQVASWLAGISREAFDLANDALLRVFLVAVDSQRHYLALISHAAVWDAWCYDLFLNELGRIYELNAEDSATPAHQYADYVCWQRNRQDSETLRKILERETARLAGMQHRARLPLDYADPDPADHSGARYNFVLEPDLRLRVKDAARKAGATPFMVLLTSYAALLSRYTGQQSVLITVPLRGREKRQFEKIFGPFTNNLFLPVNLAEQTFSSLLEVIKADIGDAFGREIAPFERLVEVLNQDLNASAFFQLQFSFQNVEDRQPAWATGITLTAGPHRDFHATHADISFWLREGRNTIDGAIDFRTAMFKKETIAHFYQRFLKLTADGLNFPDKPLAELLGQADERAIVMSESMTPDNALSALNNSLQKKGRAVAVEFSSGTHLLAETLLALLNPQSNEDSEHHAIRFEGIVNSIAKLAGFESANDDAGEFLLSTCPPTKVDLAIKAWAERLSGDDNRVYVADATLSPSTLIAWLAVLTTGATLCLASEQEANDEVSVCNLIRKFNVDLVFLPTSLMQALLYQENVPATPRYIVRVSRGAASVAKACADRGIQFQMVLADESTLGAGLMGSAEQWPYTFDRIEKGVSVCVQDDRGQPQLSGIDGRLAIALGDGPLQVLAPITTARQNVAGQFCWLDSDGNDPRELEILLTALLSLNEVIDAHVAWRNVDGASRQAIAWIVQTYGSELTTTELRRKLGSDTLAPALVISVDEIPRGHSGKVLARNLLHPDFSIVYAGFEPPASDREKGFAEIWRQVLSLERIGAHDTFANLGGNSVQALVVLSETQKQLGWSFEPRLLFFQSLRQIADRVSPQSSQGQS